MRDGKAAMATKTRGMVKNFPPGIPENLGKCESSFFFRYWMILVVVPANGWNFHFLVKTGWTLHFLNVKFVCDSQVLISKSPAFYIQNRHSGTGFRLLNGSPACLVVEHHHFCTSSTAQGGGGSFKNRKPIGEVGCCESRMAERSHWWTERWLRSLLFLSLSVSFSDYLPTYPPIYLCMHLFLSLSCSAE